MKKTLIFFCLFLLYYSHALGMGEKPKATNNNTPIYNTVQEQILYTKDAYAQAQKQPTTTNITAATFACQDLRTLFPNDNNEIVQTYFIEGKINLIQKNYAQANNLLSNFIQADQNSEFSESQAEAYYLLGTIFMQDEKFNEAIENFEMVENKFPTFSVNVIKAKQAKADCYQYLGNTLQSIQIMKKTIETHELQEYDLAYTYLKIGLSYQKINKISQARLYFQKVLELPATPQVNGPQKAASFALEALDKQAP
ncbi:MAG: tetratricopeptide repeat protein [Candidatus Margulisbacteria bacterium]|nr:tetratricopeptide repeat protein [Candidatus Margulisiibacteriota bacterium]